MEGSTPRRDLTDEQVERILSGRGTTGEDADLEALLDDFRNAYSAPPSNAARTRHLAALGAATQGAEERGGRPGRARAGLAALVRPRSGRARIALVGAALLLLAPSSAAGLATAGVVLPEDVRAPFEQIGIELPNQSPADEVHAVIESTPPEERGCEFGLRVAKAAGAGRVEDRGGCPEQAGQDERSRPDGPGPSPGGNPEASGRGRGGPPKAVPPARAGAGGGRAGQRGAAPGGRSYGERRAGEARETGPPSGGQTRPQPPRGAPSGPAEPGGGSAPGSGGDPPARGPGSGQGGAPDELPSPPSSAPGSGPQAGSGAERTQDAGSPERTASGGVR